MTKKHAKIRRLWRTYQGLLALVILLTTLILCAGCTTNIAGSDYCLLYRPIYADYDNDTPETVRQIDANNIVYDAICDR